MAENSDKLLLAIQADNTEGARLLGERWPDFVWTLQAMLREGGREEPAVRGELLLFRYPDPAAALNSLFSHLRQLKEQFHCEPSLGPLPLRIILHLEDGADDKIPPPVQLADPGGADWSGLRPETPHLSSRLRARWPELADQQKLGGFRLEAEQNGLSPLVAVTNPAGHPPLFPHRQLPLKGDKPPCFYCGLTTHEAARCPAKSLTMQTQGLPTVGYLPLAQLSELFLEAMTRQEELNGLLAAGVSPVQLRKDPLLRQSDQPVPVELRFDQPRAGLLHGAGLGGIHIMVLPLKWKAEPRPGLGKQGFTLHGVSDIGPWLCPPIRSEPEDAYNMKQSEDSGGMSRYKSRSTTRYKPTGGPRMTEAMTACRAACGLASQPRAAVISAVVPCRWST